jgi:hypothetical protein
MLQARDDCPPREEEVKARLRKDPSLSFVFQIIIELE